jgi:transcription-repair coupling factor (superfamily II helicase)
MTRDTNLTTLKEWINENIRSVSVLGLSGAAQPYFLAQFLADLDKPCLILLPHKKEAERLSKELLFFLSGPGPLSASEAGRLHEFFPYDISPLTGLSPHTEVVNERIQALYALLSDKNPIIITSLEALFQRIMPKKAFVKSLEYLEAGEDVDREELIEKLEAIGYRRCALVEERGDYSVRGGVIDMFTPLHPLPIRLEFWGELLESIRHFDPLSQR